MLGEFSYLWNTGVVLALILIANGSPIFARHFFGKRFPTPIDGGKILADGQPLLGKSKTWRGITAALVCTVAAGLLFSVPWVMGLLIAVFAMIGDLLSSFYKRRKSIPPSSMFTGVDQVPESLLPAVAVAAYFNFTVIDILLIIVGFFIFNRALSVILFKMKIRDHPY